MTVEIGPQAAEAVKIARKKDLERHIGDFQIDVDTFSIHPVESSNSTEYFWKRLIEAKSQLNDGIESVRKKSPQHIEDYERATVRDLRLKKEDCERSIVVLQNKNDSHSRNMTRALISMATNLRFQIKGGEYRTTPYDREPFIAEEANRRDLLCHFDYLFDGLMRAKDGNTLEDKEDEIELGIRLAEVKQRLDEAFPLKKKES